MKICSSCNNVFKGNERFCPSDGSELTPISEYEMGKRVGETLGDFLLETHVKSDDVADIYLAKGGDREAVVRVIHPWVGVHKAQTGNFEADLEGSKGLDNPAIHKCLAYVLDAEPRWVAWQPKSGFDTLESLLTELGPVPPALAFEITSVLALALDSLHKKRVFHRNLGSHALLFPTIGAKSWSDFDIKEINGLKVAGWAEHHLVAVKDPIGENQRNPKSYLGRPEYFSPEQAQGKPVDERSDLYGVGVLLYEMLTGKPPFTSGSFTTTLKRQIYEKPLLPRIARPGLKLSPDEESVVMRNMAKRPEDRVQSVTELLEQLQKAGYPKAANEASEDKKESEAPAVEADEDETLPEPTAAAGVSIQHPINVGAVSDEADAETNASESDEADPSSDESPDDFGTGDAVTVSTGDAVTDEIVKALTDTEPSILAVTPEDLAKHAAEKEAEKKKEGDSDEAEATGIVKEEGVRTQAPVSVEMDAVTRSQDKDGEAAKPDEAKDATETQAEAEPATSVGDEPEFEDEAEDDESGIGSGGAKGKRESRRSKRKQRRKRRQTLPLGQKLPAEKTAAASVELIGEKTESDPLAAPPEPDKNPDDKTREIPKSETPSKSVGPKPTLPGSITSPGHVAAPKRFPTDPALDAVWFDSDISDIDDAAPEPGLGSRSNAIIFGGLLIVLMFLGVGGIYALSVMNGGEPDDAEMARKLAEENESAKAHRDRILAKYNDAASGGRLIPPEPNNAFGHLRSLKMAAGGANSDEYNTAAKDFVERATKDLEGTNDPTDIRWMARHILQIDEDNENALAAFKRASADDEDAGSDESDDAADAAAVEPDVPAAEPDVAAAEPDVAAAEPDVAAEEPDVAEAKPDAAVTPVPVKEKPTAEKKKTPTEDKKTAKVVVPAADAKKEAQRKKREQVVQLLQQASKARGATAVGLYRQVILLDPSNHRAHFQLGVTLSQQGDYHSALRYLERAVQLNGRSAQYRLYLGNAYLKTGNRSKARAQYEKVIAIDKNNAVAKRMLERLQ